MRIDLDHLERLLVEFKPYRGSPTLAGYQGPLGQHYENNSGLFTAAVNALSQLIQIARTAEPACTVLEQLYGALAMDTPWNDNITDHGRGQNAIDGGAVRDGPAEAIALRRALREDAG